MKNELTFTRNNENILATRLAELEENLNHSVTDLNYSFFVLEKIATGHTNLKITRTAKEFTEKQNLAQDDLDYLNSCILFLKNQLEKAPSYNTLTQSEISERINQLATDIEVYVEVQIGVQKAYFKFASTYFQDIAKAA